MTAKEMTQRIVSHMPDESSFEDIRYHIYVLQCIEQGKKDIESGYMLTQSEVELRLAQATENSKSSATGYSTKSLPLGRLRSSA